MATRKPILNGILQSDIEGAGFAGTNWGGLEITYVTKKEIWFGIRTGGKAGSGSKDDPFDAGTAAKIATKIDWANANYDVPIFCFREGEYLYSSFHYNFRTLKPGSMIIGAGGRNGSTVLTLDPSIATSISGSIFGVTGETGVNGDGQHIEGITFDMNWTALEAAGAPVHCAVGGIGLLGDNNSVHDCVVKNHYGSNTGGNESFGIISDAVSGGTNRSSRITDCRVESPRGDYHSGIVIAGPTAAIAAAINGLIDHCEVLGYRDDTAFAGGNFHAFGIDGGTIRDCYTSGAVVALYAEQGKKIIAQNNYFADTWRFGILLFSNNSGITDVKLRDNFIEMRDDEADSDVVGIALYSGADPALVSIAEIRDNTVKLRVTGNTPGPGPFRSIYTTALLGLGYKVTGNTVDEGFNSAQTPEDAARLGNFHPDNTVIADLPDSTSFTRPDNENSSLWGSLLLQATFLSIDGYIQYTIDAGSYVIEDGDTLAFEVFCWESTSAAYAPYTVLAFSDVTLSSDLVDQHGIYLYNAVGGSGGDLSDVARGRWYRRFADLSAHVGKTAMTLGIGDIPGATGTDKAYFRNIRILNSDGEIARAFFVGDVPVIPVLGSTPVDVTNYSFSLVQARPASQIKAYATSVYPNGEIKMNFINALTGNVTIENATGTPVSGDEMVISLGQDGSGGHTIAWGTNYAFGTTYTSASIATTASAKAEITFRYSSTVAKWRCVGIAQGF